MRPLHQDPQFHFEGLRALALTRYYGGDVSEILDTLEAISAGDFEDWYKKWKNLADRVLSTIDETRKEDYSNASLRDVYFRASRYYFWADFFLHGNREDPRLYEDYKTSRDLFAKGNALLPIPGRYINIPTQHGFVVKTIFFRATSASDNNPRPTLVVGGGFDSSIEELVHVFAFAGLEREYNVVVYEGPGHLGPLHEQQKGFIYDWEKVVTPIIDFISTHNSDELCYIDPTKIGLIGYSFGGYLCARAAAFEPRLAAVIAIDGVWDFRRTALGHRPREAIDLLNSRDKVAFNNMFDSTNRNSKTSERWSHDQLKFTFMNDDAYEIFQELKKMTLDGIAHQIKMPFFVGDAARDPFFLGQPQEVAREVGANATLWLFDDNQSAEGHCQAGANVHLNQCMLDWFRKVVEK